VTRAGEVARELRRLARVAEGLQARYRAHFALHGAAVLTGDPQEIQRHRDDLHTVLDAMLDNNEAVQRYADEAEALPR
jgi:hypothetical protein